MEQERRKFFEVWGESELKARHWQAVATLCVVIAGVVVVGQALSSLRPKPIYFISGSYGLASPITGTSQMGEAFAKSFVLQLGNFTPATVDTNWAEIQKFCAPSYFGALKAQLAVDLSRIKSGNVSSSFAIIEVKTIESSTAKRKVLVNGERSLFVGPSRISEGPYDYEVTLVKNPPSLANPFGLAVENMTFQDHSVPQR